MAILGVSGEEERRILDEEQAEEKATLMAEKEERDSRDALDAV